MNKKQNLGLPPEYQERPEYFDTFNTDQTTEFKNSVIENILKKHHVKTVLDITCGTGSQVFYLKKHGYDVTGSDFSPDLITQARKKAKNQNLAITFLDADMRTVQAGKFDAVISIFNAIGHVDKKDFIKTIKNVGANLNSGGLFVFDIFNLNAMSSETVQNLSMDQHKIIGNDKIHATQHSTVDKNAGQLTSYNHYEITHGSAAPVYLKNQFTLQIYTAQELIKMLQSCGFEVLEQTSLDGSKFIDHQSLSIFTIAKKIS